MSVQRNCRRAVTAAAVLAVVVLSAVAAQAAVTAELDPLGRYVRTVIIARASVSEMAIWGGVPEIHDEGPWRVLNPIGDLNGDMWPAIVQDPNQNNYPWVVWSRFNGRDYDLGWSRWIGQTQSWNEVQWLEQQSRLGDDLDPQIDIDDSSRPYVVWWTDEGGAGRVYLSLYLESRFMPRRLVSDGGVDSRYPSLSINPDGSVIVSYETPTGTESKIVAIEGGASINDALDPVENLSVEDYQPTNLDGQM